MATYKLAEAADFTVSVRGKDSLVTRQKALDKITLMSGSGELPSDLRPEQLILTEASTITTDALDDEEQPLEMVLRELQKFFFLKLRMQRLKQGATQARQNIAAIFTSESIEQDLDQVEEMLKGDFKTLKEFVGVLKEYHQAKPGAESALIILDEALQFNRLTPAISNTSNNLSSKNVTFDTDAVATEMKTPDNDTETEVSVAEAEMTETDVEESATATEKNAFKKVEANGSKRRKN